MKLKYLLLAFAGAFLFTGCESDDPSLTIAEYHKPTTFVLNTPQLANGLYDLSNANTVNLTFSQPDYGYSAVCDYTIEVSPTEDFAQKAAVTTTYHVCDVQIPANDFALAVCTAYGWQDETELAQAVSNGGGSVPVYVRVVSKITNEKITDSEITSNVVKLDRVLPYFALPDVVMPEAVYMVGDFCGGDWANAAKMTIINGTDNQFWCIRYVGANAWFKFNTAAEWDGNQVGYDATKHEYVSNVSGVSFGGVDDGNGAQNIVLDKAGWYMFGVTLTLEGRTFKYKIEVMNPDIYVYGDCTGGSWANDAAWKFTIPTTPDGVFTSPALAAAGEVRMCVNPTPAWGGDWWKHEFTLKNGTDIFYRGNINMPNNWAETMGADYSLQGAPGKVITLDFANEKGQMK